MCCSAAYAAEVEDGEIPPWLLEEDEEVSTAPAAAEPGDTVSDVVVLLVLYDKTGQMIAMHQQVAQQSDGTRVITVQCDAALLSSNAVTVKAFVISASGDMRPLAPVPFSQTLTFGAN